MKTRKVFYKIVFILFLLFSLGFDSCQKKFGTCTIHCLKLVPFGSTTIEELDVTDKECNRLRHDEHDKCDCWCTSEFIENF
jgi:hypothetical protein